MSLPWQRASTPTTVAEGLADTGHPLFAIVNNLDSCVSVFDANLQPVFANALAKEAIAGLGASAGAEWLRQCTSKVREYASTGARSPHTVVIHAARDVSRARLSAARDASGAVLGYLAVVEEIGAAVTSAAGASQTIEQTVLELGTVANELSVGSEQTVARAAQAAAGTQELQSSVQDIARSSSSAVQTTQDAVAAVRSSVGALGELVAASDEIGGFLKLITSVAEQTKLLALNATIEAARAGEAGKGFAVVADEVKQLATTTSASSEDIARRITAIQASTRAAEQGLQRLDELIGRVSETQVEVTGAIESQAAVTAEIASAVDEISAEAARTEQGLDTIRRSADQLQQGNTALRALRDQVAGV